MTLQNRGRAVMVLVGVALAFVVTGSARGVAQNQQDLDKRFLEAWAKQTRVSIPVPPGAAAKVTIVKFNDWLCPGCKSWYGILKPVLAKYQATPGAVRYVEKDWPWNSQCNASVKTIPGHEATCAAAAAVRMAAAHGKRDTMIEWLYANQPETLPQSQLMLERIKAKATEMLGVKDFAAAYELELPAIRKDVADGTVVQIESTPTFFINGIRAAQQDGSTIPVHYMEVAIQYELNKK